MQVPVAVIGSGSIGVAFAVLFARAGADVRLFDIDAAALERAAVDVTQRLTMLHEALTSDASLLDVARRIRYDTDLASTVDGAQFVQECAPERLEIKQDLFQRIAALAPDAVLATSSSAIPASRIVEGMPQGAATRVLVGHPGNPPYLLPIIEVVPSPVTSAEAIRHARGVYLAAGMKPVTVKREVEGFVFNRLQGALLREAYCLVRDGVIEPDELDEVVRSGLGRRWSIIGPFETADLNTRGGIESHAQKMGPAYERMGAERGQYDPWTPQLVAEVVAARRAQLPLDQWDERVRWRDRRLLELTVLWDRG